MYAVIKTGGKQYRVQPGDVLVVEKIEADSPGAEVAFDQVLMLGDGGEVVVGAPVVDGAVVRGTFIETRKGEKIKVFKKKRRQGYRRTQGHRQFESVIRITGLEGGGKSESWDGEVDLTPRAVLVARARGLAPMVETAEVAALPAAPSSARRAGALVEQPVGESPAHDSQTVVDEQAAAETGSMEAAASPKKPRARKAKAETAAVSDPETAGIVDEQAAAGSAGDGRA